MPDDVIIGYDGRMRYSWAGLADTAFSRYHDEVWGTRTYDELCDLTPRLWDAASGKSRKSDTN
jgi:hypothetical protein